MGKVKVVYFAHVLTTKKIAGGVEVFGAVEVRDLETKASRTLSFTAFRPNRPNGRWSILQSFVYPIDAVVRKALRTVPR